MSQARQVPPPADLSPPPVQATEPPFIGKGHPEYHFVQAIMELKSTIHQMDTDQKVSMARMEEKLGSMKESVESSKSKMTKVESDVLEFKQIRHTAMVVGWIIVGTCTLLLGIAGFVAKEAWSILKPAAIAAIAPPPAQASVGQKLPKK